MVGQLGGIQKIINATYPSALCKPHLLVINDLKTVCVVRNTTVNICRDYREFQIYVYFVKRVGQQCTRQFLKTFRLL